MSSNKSRPHSIGPSKPPQKHGASAAGHRPHETGPGGGPSHDRHSHQANIGTRTGSKAKEEHMPSKGGR